MVAITPEQLKSFWYSFYNEYSKEEIDELIEDYDFTLAELEDEHLNSLSQDELNNLMSYLVDILIDYGGGDYESMYYCLSEDEDGIFDKETVSFLLQG